jgi:hypothetical protein
MALRRPGGSVWWRRICRTTRRACAADKGVEGPGRWLGPFSHDGA